MPWNRLKQTPRYVWIIIAVLLAVSIAMTIIFKPSSAATAILTPDVTNTLDWTAGSTGCTTTTTAHTCIDEGSPQNTVDYIGTGLDMSTTTALADFHVSNQSNVGSASQLTLYMYAWSVESQRGFDSIDMRLAVGSTTLATQTWTMAQTATWYTVTYTGNLTQAQVNDIKATFTRNVVGQGGNATSQDDDVRIASAYVVMTYTQPSVVSQAAYRWFDGEKENIGQLQPKTDRATTGSPRSVAIHDVDGDQKKDVVVAGSASDTVSIHRGNGDGTFMTQVDYTTGDAPQSIVTADFNDDSKPDIATSNINSGNASVLLNNGDGTFAAKVDYPAGIAPHDVMVGDFDLDQKLDLAVSNQINGEISFLFGNGDGTFATKVSHIVTGSTRDITVADFNDDQYDDLAIANVSSGAVTILISNGDRTFSAGVDYATNASAFTIESGDFNGDGVIDIVSGVNGTSASSMSVLIGNGDGTFATKVDYASGDGSRNLTAVDINDDQKLDVINTSAGSNVVSLLKNNGDGTFAAKVDYTTGSSPYGGAADYLNADTAIDFVNVNDGAASFSIFYGISQYPALATQDTPATASLAGVPFHLRLNLGVSDAMLSSGASYKLRYQVKSEAACSNIPAEYADITASTPIRFFDKTNLADKSAYESNTFDPVRSGIIPTAQTYNESNPFSVTNTIFAGRDGLWDFSLAIDASASAGTYCFMATKSDNTALDDYAVIPELTVVDPQVEQSNYRIYDNANSTTPGSPLAAQNTPANVAPGAPFRLRQLLHQTTESSPVGTSFLLQAGEKITTCSAATYQTLSGPVEGSSGSTGRSFTAATITGFTDSQNAQTDNGVGAYHSFSFVEKSGVRTYNAFGATLKAENFGFSIPENATINGIEYHLDVLSSGNVTDDRIFLAKTGTTMAGSDLALNSTLASRTYGSSSNLWGTTWTPAEINSSEFGLVFIPGIIDTSTYPSVSIDSLSVNIYYTVSSSSGSFYDNSTVVDDATITVSTNDPTPVSGAVRLQTYNENQSFASAVNLGQGENGLWDFALQFDPSLVGKTYCFRVVNGDNSPLASYAQYPEVTFTDAPNGPTLPQQLRGGQAVVNGQKTPFSW